MQWRHTRQYDPFGKCFLLPGQCVNVVLPRVKQRASDKLHGRSEEHIFMCYYERHGRCDGSVLTVPLRSLMTGTTSFALQRTRDWRASGEVSFPLARLREWQAITRSAKLWNSATQAELDAEVHALVNAKTYQPKIVFETPASIALAAGSDASGPWQAEVVELDSASSQSRDPIGLPPGVVHGENLQLSTVQSNAQSNAREGQDLIVSSDSVLDEASNGEQLGTDRVSSNRHLGTARVSVERDEASNGERVGTDRVSTGQDGASVRGSDSFHWSKSSALQPAIVNDEAVVTVANGETGESAVAD